MFERVDELDLWTKGKTHLTFLLSSGFTLKVISVFKIEQRTEKPAKTTTEPGQ